LSVEIAEKKKTKTKEEREVCITTETNKAVLHIEKKKKKKKNAGGVGGGGRVVQRSSLHDGGELPATENNRPPAGKGKKEKMNRGRMREHKS